MMTNTWKKITSLPEGSAITGISSETGAGSLWVCSPAGLFCEKDGEFMQLTHNIPFRSASAVLTLGKIVLAAGHPNHILYSANGGSTWFSSRVDHVVSAVTCFAASPNFSRDATLLAGCDGDGILRSIDSGSSWQVSNFGLRSLNILGLACAPTWSSETASNAVPYNYEIVFAATEDGVYMSPNAGRAWRFAGNGLPSVPVLSIAVSPDFKRAPVLSDSPGLSEHSDGLSRFSGYVFAGTDGAGLFRSQDGGQSWQAILALPTELTINTIYFDTQGRLLIGTGEEGILASSDLGETWTSLLDTRDIVLYLSAHGSKLLAGTAENGLLVLDGELSENIGI